MFRRPSFLPVRGAGLREPWRVTRECRSMVMVDVFAYVLLTASSATSRRWSACTSLTWNGHSHRVIATVVHV
jgi:hypothetical protein